MQFFKNKIVEKIGEEICSLEEAKSNLRVIDDHDDIVILKQIMAALTFAEEYIRKFIQIRKITAEIESLGSKEAYLPSEQVLRLIKVKIINDSSEIELTPVSDYIFTDNKILFKKAVLHKKVQIEYLAGYEILPESIKQGVFMHLNLLYDKQIITPEILNTILFMYKPYRILKLK